MVHKTRSEHPQNATVLGHLRRRGSLSPAEAKEVYGVSRLAARVHDLRAAGYAVDRELKADPKGRRYARYRLTGPRRYTDACALGDACTSDYPCVAHAALKNGGVR